MQQPPTTTETRVGGRAIFLIDESEGLRGCIAGGTKSKAESIATALNSLLNQLSTQADLEVAVAGYRSDGAGGADIGCRWGGPLAGKRFVPTSSLAAAPLTVESRVRRLPMPIGGKQEETIRFPIWYVPQIGVGILPVLGYAYVRHLAVAGTTDETIWTKPPLIFSFVSDWLPQQVETAVERVQALSSPAGPPLLFHIHIGGTAPGQPVLFPSNDFHLPQGAPRDLFRWSSGLPEFMVAALRDARLPVSHGARGMVYNATVADVIRILSLVKAYAQMPSEAKFCGAGDSPAPAAATVAPQIRAAETAAPQGHAAALLIFLVDRSVSNPDFATSQRTWTRLQDHANDLLTLIAKRATGEPLETAILTYGASRSGQAELRSFDGFLSGRQTVTPADLATEAIRVVEITEKMSNGIGGLITINRKRSIYIEHPPALPSTIAIRPAFAAVEQLLGTWRHQHPGGCAVVLHLSRGQCDRETTIPALESLDRSGAMLYHLIETELPSRSLSYPASDEKIDDPELAAFWQRTSPLLSAQRLTAEKRLPSSKARGFVVNARFDFLLDGILDAIHAGRVAAGGSC